LEDTFDFYANLPAYARFVNDELGTGLLRHFCQAVQGELDGVYAFLDNAPTYHDPDFAPKEWLPWLGQWVGLGAIGDHYLGIGINPDWPEEKQRRLIKEATAYWQIKGTVPGIRKAIQLWLWEESQKSRLYFVFPFGRTPTHNPPNWWSYRTPYNAIALLPFKKRKEFGDSTYPGTRYLPHANSLLTPKGDGSRYEIPYPEPPYDSQLLELDAHSSSFVENLHSRLGPNRPWLYFEDISEAEWNQIFPDIFELEPEIFPAVVRPTFMGYLAAEGAEKTTLKLDQLVLEPIEIRKHRLKLDGWPYYHAYQVPPRPGRTQTTTTSHRESYRGTPGRTWEDFYRLPYGLASGEREVTETTSTEIPAVPCTPGIKTRIPTGENTTEVVSPAVSPVTHLQLTETAPIVRNIPGEVRRGIYPGFTYKSRYVGTSRLAIRVPRYGSADARERSPGIEPISLQGISVRVSSTQNNVTGVPRINLRSTQAPEESRLQVNLSGIPNLPIKLPSNATWSVRPQLVDYDSPDPRVLLGRKSYYCPPRVIQPTEEIIKRGGKVVTRNTVARYFVPYFHHAGYYRYFPGKPSITRSVPGYKEIALCNVPYRWTTPKVKSVGTRIEVVESSLPLQQKYPQLSEICDSRNWVCSLFTTAGVVVIRNPTVFYWQSPGGKHKSFSFDPIKYPELYLEFVFTLSQSKKATARSLVCADRVIEYAPFLHVLNFPSAGVYGFKFALPLEFVESTFVPPLVAAVVAGGD
jgi:phage tail-like protein